MSALALDGSNEDPVPSGQATRARSKVLIVDDDERNLLALSEVISDVAEVVSATSGEEALRHLLKEQFAVVVLDVVMPGLDGYETARLMRGREQSRDTPIIFLTAINREDAHLLRGYSAGAVDFVFKPFEPTIVRAKVAVFVALYEKTLEVQQASAVQKRLLEEKLEAQQHSLLALNALHEVERRQELILASLPVAIYEEDGVSGVPRFVAGNLKEISGYDGAAFDADPMLWMGRVHADDRGVLQSAFEGAYRLREYRWRHADGTYRTYVDQATMLFAEGIIAGTIRDVTAQRLLQDQLLQAQKMDAIGKLTGGIAHDFNNLLASVLSGLALVRRRAQLDVRSREVLDMTFHAAEQGKHLVSRLLSFSRRQNLEPRVVDLNAVRQSLDAMLAPILGGLVTINWDLAPDLWSSFVDASQLELAIINLVINSRDAMPAGGMVTIALHNRKVESVDDIPAGEYVVITVADTGMGIRAELLPKVLEPFFTTKENGKGTGLGLSMAYGFATQSGGTLRLRSVEGRGTEVELWLPRSQDSRTEVAQAAAEASQIPVRRDSPRVLLVDDSRTLRSLTEMQLAEGGFVVSSASSAVEAIALIGQDPDGFDVLLTDYAMPLMSGLELVEAARKYRSDFPAVIVTGYAELEAINARPPDVAVLSKPFTTAALFEALEVSLDARPEPSVTAEL